MDGWWPYDDVDPIPIVFHNLWALQKNFCLYIPSHTLPPSVSLSHSHMPNVVDPPNCDAYTKN